MRDARAREGLSTLSGRKAHEERHRFAGALQSALSKEEVTAAYFASISRVIDASGVGMYQLDAESGNVIDVMASLEGDFLDDYEAYGRQDDPVLQFVGEHRRPMDSSRLVGARRWDDCGARAALGKGGYGHSMESPVMVAGMLYGTLNFARPAEQPSFSESDLTSARVVSEQMGLAIERATRFEVAGQRSNALEHALDRLPQAVVVTDLDARLIFQNRTARNEWALAAGCEADINTIDTVGASIEEAMCQFRLQGKRVHTQSVRDTRSKQQVILKSYRLSDKDRTAVTLIYNCAAEKGPRGLPAWDVLSRREQEIAQFVSEGLTTKEIAAKAFISENTVKQHLKRVFAKTDVRNRAELVQLIWTSGVRDD